MSRIRKNSLKNNSSTLYFPITVAYPHSKLRFLNRIENCTISVIEWRASVSGTLLPCINMALTGHPRRYRKDTPFSRYRPPRCRKNTEERRKELKKRQSEKGRRRERKKDRKIEREWEDRKCRVGPMRCVFRSVPSLPFPVSLSSVVASACPFVIYVCFMARRIRKRLIKDSRVVLLTSCLLAYEHDCREILSLPFDVLRASIW